MKTRYSLFALAATVLALAMGGAGCSADAEVEVRPLPPSSEEITTEEELRDDMRLLWTEHVAWTRFYIMVNVAGLPDADVAAGRLLQNQADIGDAIRPFYGDAAGDELTALLEEHILGAVDVLYGASIGSDTIFQDALDAWYDNADEIAQFLADANPEWSEDDLAAMMREHLNLTLAEASARLAGDWEADVEAFDDVHFQILHMADMLTDGIADQFPDLVARQTTPPEEEELHLAMRKLWQDHVIWTRVFLISGMAGLPDTPAATARLLQNQVDIGNAVKPYFGEEAGEALIDLLTEHILLAADIVAAAMAGDDLAFEEANALWYDNAHDIAVFLSSANPNQWSEGELHMMMNDHLDLTLEEATARLSGDYEADVAAYDAVELEIVDMADVLSQGISDEYPGVVPLQ